jgi:hypothetical protein
MLIIHCYLQQEIGEASDDVARKYYEGQFLKYLAIANPKFGDKFLEEVGFSFMTPFQCIIIQYQPSIDIPWHCCRSRSTGATTRSLRCL